MAKKKKRKYSKQPIQRVVIKFEKFQILGPVNGNFVLQELDGEMQWDDDKQDYVWHETPGKIVAGPQRYYTDLVKVIKAIQERYWDVLQIGREDNEIEEIWELLAVAERIDKRMEKLEKKFSSKVWKNMCKDCRAMLDSRAKGVENGAA